MGVYADIGLYINVGQEILLFSFFLVLLESFSVYHSGIFLLVYEV